MTHLTNMVTVDAVEHLDEEMLQSKFVELLTVHLRTQAAVNERTIALMLLRPLTASGLTSC